MKPIGKHLTVDMYGCDFAMLNDIEFIKNSLFTAVEQANMTMLDFTYYQFEPQGLTALLLLSESHMSIHTYPELGYAAFDVFSCGDQSSPDKAIAVLKKLLKPEKTRSTNIRRGDFGTEKDMKPKVRVSVTPLTRFRDTGAKVFRFLARSRKS